MTRLPFALLALAGTLTIGLGACSSVVSDSEADTTVEGGPDHGAVVVRNDEDIVITGDKSVQNRACTGQDVQLVGSDNQATFTGTCGDVAVVGSGNRISVENASSIDVAGTNNTVTWRGTKPKVSSLGTGNRITRAK